MKKGLQAVLIASMMSRADLILQRTLEEYKIGGTRIRVCGCARLRITGLFL